MTERPVASLSLDLDNKWSYLKTHGDPAWQEFPSYLDRVVPRILQFLMQRDLKVTFFIVGQDADLEQNRVALKKIADAGHEIGNHSYRHEPWLHLYSETELDEELERAEVAIEKATGCKPKGFRGPGFSLSAGTLKVLLRRGFEYDCTVFPNLLNPLARAYFFATSNLSKAEKEQRKALFGTWKDALRSVKPFRWQDQQGIISSGGKSLLEIPVTTMPWFKIPIHLSYILYLAKFVGPLALLYFRFALFMCRLTGSEPSILLHPLDFMGRGDDQDLLFFPGMDMDVEKKLSIVDSCLQMLKRHYRIVSMYEHAEIINQGPQATPMVEPKFSV